MDAITTPGYTHFDAHRVSVFTANRYAARGDSATPRQQEALVTLGRLIAQQL